MIKKIHDLSITVKIILAVIIIFIFAYVAIDKISPLERCADTTYVNAVEAGSKLQSERVEFIIEESYQNKLYDKTYLQYASDCEGLQIKSPKVFTERFGGIAFRFLNRHYRF
jgi:hypothetical protein